MKQTSQSVNSKTQQKITWDLILYCVKSEWFYSIQIWSLKQHFIHENPSRDALNHHKICEIAIWA